MPWRMREVPLCSPFPFLCQAENRQTEPVPETWGVPRFPSVLPIEQSVVVWPLMDEEGFYPGLPPWAKDGPRALWLSVLPSASGLGPQGTHQGPCLQLGCVGRAAMGREGSRSISSARHGRLHELFSSLPVQVLPIWQSQAMPVPVGSLRGDGWSPFSPHVPGCSLCPPLPLSEEHLGRHIYALCITFPTSLHTFPLGLDSVISGPRFWSSLRVPPSLSASSSSLPWVLF